MLDLPELLSTDLHEGICTRLRRNCTLRLWQSWRGTLGSDGCCRGDCSGQSLALVTLCDAAEWGPRAGRERLQVVGVQWH